MVTLESKHTFHSCGCIILSVSVKLCLMIMTSPPAGGSEPHEALLVLAAALWMLPAAASTCDLY